MSFLGPACPFYVFFSSINSIQRPNTTTTTQCRPSLTQSTLVYHVRLLAATRRHRLQASFRSSDVACGARRGVVKRVGCSSGIAAAAAADRAHNGWLDTPTEQLSSESWIQRLTTPMTSETHVCVAVNNMHGRNTLADVPNVLGLSHCESFAFLSDLMIAH